MSDEGRTACSRCGTMVLDNILNSNDGICLRCNKENNHSGEKPKKAGPVVFAPTEFDDLLDRIIREATSSRYGGTSALTECESYAEIKALKPEKKPNFIFAMLSRIIILGENTVEYHYGDPLNK